MAPVLDVRPDAFWEAAQTVIGDAMPPVQRSALALCASLDGCAGMAGSDPPSRQWAAAYDAAARSAIAATRTVLDSSYHVGVLLELTGLNHAHAEAASVAGPLAGVPVRAHEPGWRAVLGEPPSAGGGDGEAPTGWNLIQHLVGYAWPNGHQDRLRAAADAWDEAAAGLDEGAGLLPSAIAVIAIVTSPEVDDAMAVLRGLADRYADVARAHRGLARLCRELAHHIDVAHSEVEETLVELLAFIGGAEIVGGLLSVVSFGAAELPTQAAVASRVAATADTVRTVLITLADTITTLTSGIPSLTELIENATLVLQRYLGLRPAVAGVEAVRHLPGVMHMAGPVGRAAKELAAEQRLAAAATRRIEKAESVVWKNLKPWQGRYRTNGIRGRRRCYYDWDNTHGDIEVYDHNRDHLGSMDPITGKMIKPPVPHRRMK